MKRVLLVFSLVLLAAGLASAQKKMPYRVVFDLTSRDSLDQKALLRWIQEISEASPDAEMEVVMYGKGFELVMPDRSALLPQVKEAMNNPKVSFKVCQIAMKNNKIDRSMLLPQAVPVPDGIHEIVTREQENWGYIKVVH